MLKGRPYWNVLKQTGNYRSIIRNRWTKEFNYDFPLVNVQYSNYRTHNEVKIALIGFELVVFIDKYTFDKDDPKQPWNLRK